MPQRASRTIKSVWRIRHGEIAVGLVRFFLPKCTNRLRVAHNQAGDIKVARYVSNDVVIRKREGL